MAFAVQLLSGFAVQKVRRPWLLDLIELAQVVFVEQWWWTRRAPWKKKPAMSSRATFLH